MTRVLILGGSAAHAMLLAQALVGSDIEVVTVGEILEPKQELFELDFVTHGRHLELPKLYVDHGPPQHQVRDFHRESRHAQAAKQQSLRAKARRR